MKLLQNPGLLLCNWCPWLYPDVSCSLKDASLDELNEVIGPAGLLPVVEPVCRMEPISEPGLFLPGDKWVEEGELEWGEETPCTACSVIPLDLNTRDRQRT